MNALRFLFEYGQVQFHSTASAILSSICSDQSPGLLNVPTAPHLEEMIQEHSEVSFMAACLVMSLLLVSCFSDFISSVSKTPSSNSYLRILRHSA